MIYTLEQPKSILKNSYHAILFKLEEISKTIQGLAQKFKDFSRKNCWSSVVWYLGLRDTQVIGFHSFP